MSHRNEMFDFFLTTDFEAYLYDMFWYTGIVKNKETIPEFIEDVRYTYKEGGYEAFFGMLDDEDFTYFPELRSMMIEWHVPQ